MDQAQIDAELKGLEGMWDDVDMEVDENGEDVIVKKAGAVEEKGKGKAGVASTCECSRCWYELGTNEESRARRSTS